MAVSTFALPSRESGTDYRIYVEAADGPKTESVPAMIFLDGDDQFAAATAAYQAALTATEVPPLLLVGVGYGASYTKPGNRRVRDYTPTALPTEADSGGADAFLAFLSQTLWPELARRYSIDPAIRGLGGHSLGSLMALHALLQPRPFFNRILASAPSLWWDNRALLCAADRLQRIGAALPARLFFGVGTDDTTSMTEDLELFEQQLAARPFPGLEITSERFPAHDHYNVLPVSFRAGLRALFA